MGLFDIFKTLFGQKSPKGLPQEPKPLPEDRWWRILRMVEKLSNNRDEDPVQLVESVIGGSFKGKGLLNLALLAKQLMDRANTPGLHAACKLLRGNADRETFRSFRFWLMCQGQEVYTGALTDADSLSALSTRQWQADAAWKNLLQGIEQYYGEPLPTRWQPADYRSSALSEEEVHRTLPKLVAGRG
ncbi:MAG: DUF4240 domain-containing protein [Bacteroidetes bacterium]|nr:DUF4240 domain-containing protein [Bacteroidota bacterium]